MTSFFPIILCGGSGKRLWPLSRDSYPKQFTKLTNDSETMLQSTVLRLMEAGGEKAVLLSGNEYRFLVGEQLETIGITDRQVIIEPVSRNTAPAICAAALILEKEYPNAIMVVSPSDHHISDNDKFSKQIQIAVNEAKEGHIVTLGVLPSRPETGYGYIKLKDKLGADNRAQDFESFVEKPDLETAEKMIASNQYLWNSGIFIFSVSRILSDFLKYAPDIYESVKLAVDAGETDLDFFRLGQSFSNVEDLSFDYAIMEQSNGKVVPLDCGWNDLGSWATVLLESNRDEDGNATKGSTSIVDCKNSLLRAENEKIHLVGIGLENIAAIAMGDAVLVADLNNSQSVSDMVTHMRELKIPQANEFPRAARPWGWYETLTKGPRFRVKSIVVKPEQKLSLQSHVHRAEHWIVVEGTAKITIDNEIKMITENESVYIPLGSKHRLENPGHVDLHLIEVQTGAYLEEDDIVRYEDIYSRK